MIAAAKSLALRDAPATLWRLEFAASPTYFPINRMRMRDKLPLRIHAE
ncbi:hypothetical protein [Variovorax paradoxus]|uniref:Uncharacterized protein n=1 Tax=Variovorax paradoxus TaxID=34073 RepID=A0A0H2LR93_VARPD|nr:hypothetical protein [Variovorax paradoxus]KLN52833.1 hypothetical protein VPARA_60030 [Variovorax paradoxus]